MTEELIKEGLNCGGIFFFFLINKITGGRELFRGLKMSSEIQVFPAFYLMCLPQHTDFLSLCLSSHGHKMPVVASDITS